MPTKEKVPTLEEFQSFLGAALKKFWKEKSLSADMLRLCDGVLDSFIEKFAPIGADMICFLQNQPAYVGLRFNKRTSEAIQEINDTNTNRKEAECDVPNLCVKFLNFAFRYENVGRFFDVGPNFYLVGDNVVYFYVYQGANVVINAFSFFRVVLLFVSADQLNPRRRQITLSDEISRIKNMFDDGNLVGKFFATIDHISIGRSESGKEGAFVFGDLYTEITNNHYERLEKGDSDKVDPPFFFGFRAFVPRQRYLEIFRIVSKNKEAEPEWRNREHEGDTDETEAFLRSLNSKINDNDYFYRVEIGSDNRDSFSGSAYFCASPQKNVDRIEIRFSEATQIPSTCSYPTGYFRYMAISDERKKGSRKSMR